MEQNPMANIFNLISEQVPNVLNQTFTNNQFTFNNLFNNGDSTQTSQTQPPPRPQPPQPQQQPQPSTTQPETSEQAEAPTPGINIRRRASLSDIKAEAEIESLTIKQIKEILSCNFVDYKGCCEKKELVEKTKRLYASYQENKRLESELSESQEKQSGSAKETETSGKSKKVDEEDLCKICMEAVIDCVLLDCGHMVSCIKCGKRLAECPMCRQNIVRVIRVFKS